ncbi:UrcA family protein [Novosphingobium malaysiense]|uniref:UrcA family protein n=1 Tax=Novosphingobium malaysiense TaxID=1348853 RepID=A0A0B1ZF25_9SPHN|nr:UrcA family protein [Novosphingobium malaysiense]KHK89624.1 hypothetical protein LK12_21360 [Novosphingobium malaysiense]
MFKNAPIAAALIGLALTAAPAMAGAGDASKVRVEYKDLDLTTADGQRTLERRLDAAARNACGYETRVTGSNLPSMHARQCYRQAKSRAKDVMASAIDKATSDARLGG